MKTSVRDMLAIVSSRFVLSTDAAASRPCPRPPSLVRTLTLICLIWMCGSAAWAEAVQAVWTWGNDESLTCQVFDQDGHYAISVNYGGGLGVATYTNIPNSTITPAPAGGFGPVIFTIDPVPASGITLSFIRANLNSYNSHAALDTTATVTVTHCGQVEWTSTKPVSTYYITDFGSYTVVPQQADLIAVSGAPQTGVVASPLDKQIVAKLDGGSGCQVANQKVTFEVVTTPRNAARYALGADETATSSIYTATTDANGIARATVILGDKEGDYTIRASTPVSSAGSPVDFTVTAKKPDHVAILKDTTDIADRADSYAVSSDEPTRLFAVGLDKAGQKIGPTKCNWSTAASGNTATRGDGMVAPVSNMSSTMFTPIQVGHLTISANPAIGGIPTAKADLFLTKIYVEVEGFDPDNPVDQLDQYLPGATLAGTSISPSMMPQQIRLHVLTGATSHGSVTFQLNNVSNYPGIAMNYPVTGGSTSPDMYFSGGNPATVQFSGSGDTTATLYVNDYAAYGNVLVTIKSGKKSYSLKRITLPVDENANKIADRGWLAETASVPDPGLDAGADEDSTPVMRPAGGQFLPNDGYGQLGDNLTNFEEYRGFVFFGRHVRTNPFHKDAFVEATDFGDDIQFAYPALPTSTHRVSVAEANAVHEVNVNWQGLPGASRPFPNGHRDAVAVHVARGGLNPGLLGDTVCVTPGLSSPCVPPYARDSVVYQGTIDQDAAQHNITDPDLIATLRRSIVAHEVGHAHNLLHNDSPQCLMFGLSFSQYQGWGAIPVNFCYGIDTTLIGCVFCGTTNLKLPVTNFNETDTLRFKERP